MYDQERKNWRIFCDKQSTKFNEFATNNIIWIFASSETEFLKKVEEHGRTLENLTSIGAGGYVFDESKKDLLKLMQELHDEKANFLKDFNNFCGAFLSELWNYEIEISLDTSDLDIINDLLDYNNITFEDLTNEQRLELLKVRKHYRKEFYKYN